MWDMGFEVWDVSYAKVFIGSYTQSITQSPNSNDIVYICNFLYLISQIIYYMPHHFVKINHLTTAICAPYLTPQTTNRIFCFATNGLQNRASGIKRI